MTLKNDIYKPIEYKPNDLTLLRQHNLS